MKNLSLALAIIVLCSFALVVPTMAEDFSYIGYCTESLDNLASNEDSREIMIYLLGNNHDFKVILPETPQYHMADFYKCGVRVTFEQPLGIDGYDNLRGMEATPAEATSIEIIGTLVDGYVADVGEEFIVLDNYFDSSYVLDGPTVFYLSDDTIFSSPHTRLMRGQSYGLVYDENNFVVFMVDGIY